jgi:uncharacterized membrane protein YozB (DUF420 family)
MTFSRRSDWLVPAGLIVLSFVPVLAGGSRVVQLTTGAAVTADNARFFASPVPIVLHIVGATLFAVLGALQFNPRLRRRRWHRLSGRIVVPAGLVTAFTGVWITVFSGRAPLDGDVLAAIRIVVGTAMTVFLLLGLRSALRREFRAHRNWMIRGYALGFGAGTQLVTQLPWIVLVGPLEMTSKTVLMALAWLINVVLAEWVIRRGVRVSGPQSSQQTPLRPVSHTIG